MRIVVYLLAAGLALVVLARLIPGEVGYTSDGAVVVFAIVLGLLNALVRPVLQLIAAPLSCLTFGLAALLVNALVFYLAAWLSIGIHVTYLGALAGTLTVGLLVSILHRVFRASRSW